jgi:hypothetical protein
MPRGKILRELKRRGYRYPVKAITERSGRSQTLVSLVLLRKATSRYVDQTIADMLNEPIPPRPRGRVVGEPLTIDDPLFERGA